MTIDGVDDIGPVGEDDVVLATCPNAPGEEGKLHFERYCLDMRDGRDASESYIDALYELDAHLKRLRKKGFE